MAELTVGQINFIRKNRHLALINIFTEKDANTLYLTFRQIHFLPFIVFLARFFNGLWCCHIYQKI